MKCPHQEECRNATDNESCHIGCMKYQKMLFKNGYGQSIPGYQEHKMLVAYRLVGRKSRRFQ